MNSRRRRSNIRQPLPGLRRWSVYRTVSLLRIARQVLGVGRGLNVRFGSEPDIGRSLRRCPLYPESGHARAGQGISALCQNRK